jgi:hypothetical protein
VGGIKSNVSALAAPRKTELFELLEFPLVRRELARIAPLNRANFPASGPVIVSESTGLPWSTSRFRDRWRELARKAGIPDKVQNRDVGPAPPRKPTGRTHRARRSSGC